MSFNSTFFNYKNVSIFRKKHLLYPKQDTEIYIDYLTSETKLNQYH